MAHRRTIKTVNSSFIEDAETIVNLLNQHMRYLRVDSEHYKAISTLNSRVVETAREVHGGPVPWGLRSSTGPYRADT
jgi:hypothetical protein